MPITTVKCPQAVIDYFYVPWIVCALARARACVRACVRVCVRAHSYAFAFTFTYACACACACACMYAYMCLCMCITRNNSLIASNLLGKELTLITLLKLFIRLCFSMWEISLEFTSPQMFQGVNKYFSVYF